MSGHYGAIEAGGTKFVCLVGTGPDDVVAQTQFPTADPAASLEQSVAFFRETSAAGIDLLGVGIASFGPVELRTDAPNYGFITKTPKLGWSNVDVVGSVRAALSLPVGLDTDVNGAALGEGRWGAARELDTFVYLTVGTGIGGGAIVEGRPAHGLVHPEMGHVTVPRERGDDFPGVCPFHGDCLEGMASGTSLAERWGRRPEELAGAELEQALDLEASYLAAGLRNIVYTLAPQRIVLGGGVSKLSGLLPAVRKKLGQLLADYPGLPEHQSEEFVQAPELGDRAGALGALVLAERAVRPGAAIVQPDSPL